jgi:radical SAM superfamily enzyme YgiQ (UPF0313 family)
VATPQIAIDSEMRIYLADLGHNQLTISSDVYPLGVANLTTYVQAYAALKEPLQISLFREPQDLKAALDEAPPDALGLSSYAWNHELSLSFARYAKASNARTLTLMGGPNFPLTAEEQERFLREIPEIDIAVRGATYESERAFLNLIRRFVEADGELQAEPVPGNLWIDRRTGEFVRGAEVERIRDLDEIPSPYLAGLMDPFLATGYFPILQIARGCPFSCSFCDSSVASNNRVFRHSVENVKADLLYIAERVRPEITLCFADDNFGMYASDEEIADYLGYLQERFHWPRYIRTTTGKNKSERIIRVMRKVRGAMPMTAAVQSLNPVVLKNIERSNISLETYAEIQREVQAQGMQSYGELILSLPGETRASFMQAVRDLLEAGVKRVSAHQLMLLPGAPLSSPESRARFGFETRFRVVARNIGDYHGEPIVEVEEMVVATPTFSFEDYLEARVFHLLLTIFYYEGNFEEAFAFARHRGVRPFDLIVRLQGTLPQAPADFRNLIADFVRESQEELFETKEACLAWARQRFDALVDGSLGGNLLSKYSMLGRFYTLDEALDFLQAGIQYSIDDSGARGEPDLLKTVIEYLRCVMLSAPFADSLRAQPELVTSYDVELWSGEDYVKDLAAYRFQTPQRRATSVAPEQRALIESRIATFGESPAGLGKFTRTMFARDLRRSIHTSETSYVGHYEED